MKTYRILYWLGSIITEYLVKAESEEEAEKKFRDLKGNVKIEKIEKMC